MNGKRNTFVALVLALVLTTPALGGIIHSDSPGASPTPAPPTNGVSAPAGETTEADGIIHSDATATEATAADTLTEAALSLAHFLMSLI